MDDKEFNELAKKFIEEEVAKVEWDEDNLLPRELYEDWIKHWILQERFSAENLGLPSDWYKEKFMKGK